MHSNIIPPSLHLLLFASFSLSVGVLLYSFLKIDTQTQAMPPFLISQRLSAAHRDDDDDDGDTTSSLPPSASPIISTNNNNNNNNNNSNNNTNNKRPGRCCGGRFKPNAEDDWTRWVVSTTSTLVMLAKPDAETIGFMIGALGNAVWTKCLKHIINHDRPKHHHHHRRDATDDATPTTNNTDAAAAAAAKDASWRGPGMPSSHASSLFFFASYIALTAYYAAYSTVAGRGGHASPSPSASADVTDDSDELPRPWLYQLFTTIGTPLLTPLLSIIASSPSGLLPASTSPGAVAWVIFATGFGVFAVGATVSRVPVLHTWAQVTAGALVGASTFPPPSPPAPSIHWTLGTRSILIVGWFSSVLGSGLVWCGVVWWSVGGSVHFYWMMPHMRDLSSRYFSGVWWGWIAVTLLAVFVIGAITLERTIQRKIKQRLCGSRGHGSRSAAPPASSAPPASQ